METRFKNLFHSRRNRSSANVNESLITQSAPYEASSPSSRQPIFLYQPLVKSAAEVRRDALVNNLAAMQSLSYDQVTPGKAPIFLQALPEKGNGPVKLQATRRLSSGEIITTTNESNNVAFEEIRQGEYIVAKKERPVSHEQSNHASNLHRPQISISPHSIYTRSSPGTSRVSPTAQNLSEIPASELLNDDRSFQATPTKGSSCVGLGMSPRVFQGRQSSDSSNDHRSIMSRPSLPGSRLSSSTSALRETNATLEALRKAEYSRLVELYGHTAAAEKIARLNNEHLRPTDGCSPPRLASRSPVILEPLPAPPTDKQNLESRRTSSITTTDSYGDDWSGTSSPQRGSYVSSYAESSNATGQTSITEDEVAGRREDIRKIVEQMRSTYLIAIDQRAPAPARPKSQHRKRKQPKRPKLMPSPAIKTAAGVPSTTTSPSEKAAGDSEPFDAVPPQRRRIQSQPVSSTSRLSPIQASPSRGGSHDQGLQRADSTTLGVLMGDFTRTKLRNRALRNTTSNSSRPVTPENLKSEDDKCSWLNLESDSTDEIYVESPHESCSLENDAQTMSRESSNDICRINTGGQSIGDEIDSMYQAYLGNDAEHTWSSSTLIERSPDLSLLNPSEVNKYLNHSHTPIRHIASIPESPEYTHLAHSNPTENNFF